MLVVIAILVALIALAVVPGLAKFSYFTVGYLVLGAIALFVLTVIAIAVANHPLGAIAWVASIVGGIVALCYGGYRVSYLVMTKEQNDRWAEYAAEWNAERARIKAQEKATASPRR